MNLEHPDTLHLDAARGWLELGNPLEASGELERLSTSVQEHPDVLEVRWQIHARNGKFDACLPVAEAAIAIAPWSPHGWINRAFALHELKRTQEAYEKLLPVANRFPKLWTIPYNLACYCAQLGRFDECEKWLAQARSINDGIVKRAMAEDPDLQPWRDQLKGGK